MILKKKYLAQKTPQVGCIFGGQSSASQFLQAI